MKKWLRYVVFFLVMLFELGLFAQKPCDGNNLGGYLKPNKSFEIVSILVDACDGSNEGQNEMLRIITGPSELRLKNLRIADYASGMVNWGSSSNPWRGFQSIGNSLSSKINIINQSIKNAGRCGYFKFVGPNDPIPKYSQLLIITSEEFNPYAHDFSGIEDSIYIAIQIGGNTAGHFVNFGNNSTRTLRLYYGNDWDEVTYNRSKLKKQDLTIGGEDGAVVNFSYAGSAEYGNYGCSVPFEIPKIDAGEIDPPSCDQDFIELKGNVIGFNCYRWSSSNGSGYFEDSLELNTRYYFGPNKNKKYVLYLTAFNNCGNELVDSIEINFPEGPRSSIIIDSSQNPIWCFENHSLKADYYQWNYITSNIDTTWGTQNINDFPCINTENTEGLFCLTALNTQTGCKDSVCISFKNNKLSNSEDYIYISNVFTPGIKDGLNDELRIESKGVEDISLVIFNRWGAEVFNSKTIENWGFEWNGQVQNTGALCPAGSYFYVLNYNLKGQWKQVKGSVTLIR